jgi:SAM-dependent methyltransferase
VKLLRPHIPELKDPKSHGSASFDAYAASYDWALWKGLAATGEDGTYYARRRIQWLRGFLDRLRLGSGYVIEFGCGTGTNVPYLVELAGAASVIGIDLSEQSLEVAQRRFRSEKVRFFRPREYTPAAQADLVFCNGVFHHIPPADRAAAIGYIHRCLKPGGLFSLWENNPWNPGTRFVMSRIAFDADAIKLSPWEAQRLVRKAGFEILRTDFLFIFPRLLRWLRGMEPYLSRLPLGGQYEILSRRL